MAGPRQPEEMVLIIFASSLPSRLLPQCCSRISTAANDTPPPPYTHKKHHNAKQNNCKDCLWRDVISGNFTVFTDAGEERQACWQKLYTLCIPLVNIYLERCLNGAELCKRVNKCTHESFHIVADVKMTAVRAKQDGNVVILYNDPDFFYLFFFILFLGHQDSLMPHKVVMSVI